MAWAYLPGHGRTPAKYRNEKVHTKSGETYDSRKEFRRAKELELLERAGEISNLRRQVKYILIPAQRGPEEIGPRGGRRPGPLLERECSYVADFVYEENGETVVEDVKGYREGQAYNVFVIKRKLMLWIHGIRIREV